jgi:hypothetical protein
MNAIITERTTPNIRFKIQGIILCEKLNRHLLWKKHMDAIYRSRLDEHEYVIEE